MAKEQEVSLPVLDDLVRDYADGVVGQATGAWQQCDAMRQALQAGDIDAGLALMREVCPAALEDLRLVFRAKKQKFVELLRTGGDPEAALVCARAELAPLALDAYPEAYGEFKRLLLLLLLVDPTEPAQRDKQSQNGQQQQQPAAAGAGGSGSGSGGRFCGVDTSGLWDSGSTAEFADLAFFTVRSMLGLQQPLLSLQLRFLLRLHGSHPAAGSTPGAAAAAELAPRLRSVPGGGGGAERDPPPLPPLTAPGRAGGGGPPCFPEAGVQAVIHGAGTSRLAAMDALKRSGGDALSAFKAEVGRLRLNEQLLAELVLEYGRFRGVLSVQQSEALQARAAGAGGKGGAASEPPPTSQSQPQPQPPQPPPSQHQQAAAPSQQQQQQQEKPQGGGSLPADGPGRPGVGAELGPLGWARGDATRGGSSPPSKLARRSPPTDGADGGGGGDEGDDRAGGRQQMDVEMGQGASGQPVPSATEAAADGEVAAGDRADAAAGAASPSCDLGAGPESGSGSGSGSGGSQQLRGQEVLSALLRLGQEGDAAGVLSLVGSVDPLLWTEHPSLLFDVRRCQYGKLLAEGDVTAALELARRELTPMASANPALLPLLKSAMAALLPPLPGTSGAAAPPPPQPVPPLFLSPLPTIPGVQAPLPAAAAAAAAAVAGAPPAAAAAPPAPAPAAASTSSTSSLLPSLPAVVGTIQAVMQPRLGLQGPRLIRLMEGLLASHRAWMRAERMSSDPFAEAMRISALRAAPAAGAAAAGSGAAAPSQSRQQPSGAAAAAAAAAAGGMAPAGAAAVPPPPPPPLPAGMGAGLRGAGLSSAARALERMLRESGAAERGLMQPWYEMEQQILAQINLPYGRGQGPMAYMGFPGLGAGDEEEGHAGGGGGGGGRAGGGGAAPGGGAGVGIVPDEEDDDDDDDSGDGGGGGMVVDEEGVVQLMEILELPRGAAVELLQNHDGDVQAAVLSVMGG